MKRILIGLLLILGSYAHGQQEYQFPLTPNPKTSPGGICSTSDGDFQGYRYSWKIPVCRRNVSDGLKHTIYEAYGIPARCRRNFTIDHIIPLSIGGSNRADNLWPEHRRVKETRLQFEDEIHKMVGSGRVSQRDAINMVRRIKFSPALDWSQAKARCN